MRPRLLLVPLLAALLLFHFSSDCPKVHAEETDAPADGLPKVEESPTGVPPGSTTDTQTQEREKASIRKSGEKFQFQAEVSRLMDIIINSLYSNKDIFLRELISNASDALDKIRFTSLTDKSVLGEGDTAQLEIKIKLDKDNKILSIRDRGIGMTKDDLIKNLGTIAKSGTSAFVEKMQTSGDLSLIGQFGVGFYSVYLVGDYVEVVSKHNDDKQWVWASSADGNFDVYEDTESEPLGRGTEIRIHLKDDASDYLEEDKLKELVKKYSQFINFPIYLWTSKEVEVEVPVEEEVETEKEEEDKPDTEKEDEKDEKDEKEGDSEDEEDDEEEEEPKTKTVKETKLDWDLLNDVKAIWLRAPKDIKDEEYKEFYKSVGKDFSSDPPMQWTHFNAEGDVEFKAILYIPPKAPHDMYENYYSAKSGLKLYVRRVFISDDFEDLLPKYLNFLKGLVDSDSLPLNVSREMLQQHGALKTIKKKLVRKALDMIRKLAEDDETQEKNKDSKEDGKYIKFWKEFGKSIKLGIIEDANNRMRLAKLLRVKTSKYKDTWTTLDDYISRMKDGQKQIYYLTGPSIEQLEKSPFLEKLLKKGYEVVYFTDPVDEYLMQNLTEYEEKKFQNASKEDLKIGSKKEREKDKDLKESFKALTTWWKKQLSSDVETVKVSDRLAETPVIVVTSKYGWSANMERIMTSQALGDASRQSYMKGRKTLEINPRHPIIKELKDIVDKDADDESGKEMAKILYDTALLESGFTPPDPKDFAARIYDTVRTNLGIDPNAEVEQEEEVPEEEDSKDSKEDDDEDEGPQFEGFEGIGKEEEDSSEEGSSEEKPGISVEEIAEDEAEKLSEATGVGKDEL